MAAEKPKYPRKKCAHHKYPYTCITCKGAGRCEHKKVRSGCKLCKLCKVSMMEQTSTNTGNEQHGAWNAKGAFAYIRR
jgi:hypothetical protein